ncbi:MAG: hypothetical protein KFF68_05385, partial [Desulfosarcina sp.]|nr:hypothetical protein [Desulfosarcina sp.]
NHRNRSSRGAASWSALRPGRPADIVHDAMLLKFAIAPQSVVKSIDEINNFDYLMIHQSNGQ